MVITCINQNGDKLRLGWFAPLFVKSVSGLGADFTVTTTKNSGQDGVNFIDATANQRNIVLVLDVLKADYIEQRNRLYQFFQPRAEGEICYEEEDVRRKTNYYVESIEPSGDGILKTITISLLCPNPKWYALEASVTELASWEGLIEWPLSFSEKFEMTRKVNTLIGNVYTESTVPIGLSVMFRASGTVVNPSLYDVKRRKLMQINIKMFSGDIITVTTADGDKRVKLLSGGVTKNINNLMAYPPQWLKAYQGDNLYRYNAEDGIDNLSVTILSTQTYWGV
ncbi:phage tail domain-containing protein [Clostridium merdae]|uniref:phage tail domain-containing protein n=1 Tax=Clostridium merdae TaxID=1958780 RepID=UPI000A26E916|nr:phage tail domain-containing protein [Clostridium merdae]